jgi:hypothetical protein
LASIPYTRIAVWRATPKSQLPTISRGLIAENAPADVQDHWTVPPQQRFESQVIAHLDESAEQMAIG